MARLPDSALKYMLLGLIPYTEANLKLSFKPHLFFNDLEKIDAKKRYSKKHWQNTYYNARKAGLVDVRPDKSPFLTSRGKALLELYQPRHFKGSVELMVIFDIPEHLAAKRQALRRTLKQIGCKQIQRSVWTTKLDVRNYLRSELLWLGIEEHVVIYEVVKQ